jgi:hypothetical protein
MLQLVGLSRILQELAQFSIGPQLPNGTIVCVDQDHMRSSAALCPDPGVFDALRLHRQRRQDGRIHSINTLLMDLP